ncbi:MAG: hypothetical protein CMP24_05935 [Rickettsiales bacterium]|nr:hypothetical protein [Rickettsiales bacterium]|tara:strand:+ start:315 stop:599 length:285 start_codon:yes stop_codon:yes gene_type:complete
MNKKRDFNERLSNALKSKEKNKTANSSNMSGYSIAMNLTIELITGMAIGFFLGMLLDNYLQTKPLMLIIFIVLGTIVGFYNMFRMLKKYGYFIK